MASSAAGVRPGWTLERLLCDHSIPLAATIAMGMVVLALLAASRAVERSAYQLRGLGSTRAALAAEEAAFSVAIRAGSSGAAPIRVSTSWGLDVDVQRVRDGGERLELTVPSRRGAERYSCELLRGAAPRCFGRRLTLGSELPDATSSWVRGAGATHAASQPQVALPPAAASAMPGLACDTEVAFLHLSGGTDRPDFTLGSGMTEIVPPSDMSVMEVRGNLWLPPDARPLRFVLRSPLTIVVHGNVYVGRSIDVSARAPLTLVAHRRGPTFRDLNGDGACSAGEPSLGGAGNQAIEGDGSFYFGLPRQETRPLLTVAAHAVAEGEIHLLGSLRMHGALVGAHGLTRCGEDVHLDLTGTRLLDPSRTRVPAFATSGGPRPGALQRAFGLR
ncbi:MAG: hypothetical protein R3F56_11125 [Planctomycetota bacterium]